MTFADVPARVRAVLSAVAAIWAFKSCLLATLVLLMVGESAFAAKGAIAIRAGVLLLGRFLWRYCRRHRCRRIRLEDIASRESIIILNLAWNTKKTRRSRQSFSRHDMSDIEIAGEKGREIDANLYVSNLFQLQSVMNEVAIFIENEKLSMIKCVFSRGRNNESKQQSMIWVLIWYYVFMLFYLERQ